MGVLRTFLYAVSAPDTAVWHPDDLLLIRDELRIVTPEAVQRTSLQKDGGPYPRSVLRRKFLYAADQRCQRFRRIRMCEIIL